MPTRQPRRREDVGLLAVDVVQQRDVRRAVGVVLDRRDARGHAVLAPLEVDLAVQALGAAAAVARGLAPAGVAPAGLRQALDERLLGLGRS